MTHKYKPDHRQTEIVVPKIPADQRIPLRNRETAEYMGTSSEVNYSKSVCSTYNDRNYSLQPIETLGDEKELTIGSGYLP